MSELPQGTLGYAIDDEHLDELAGGDDPIELMSHFADAVPSFNEQIKPDDIVKVVNQGSVGSCQGNALATVFQICYFLATGRFEVFSRAAGYYLAQRKDGIRGDRGSTLSGGRWVATEHGMCLDSDWEYVARYNPKEPPGIDYQFKLKVSRPFRDADELVAWIKLGLPVQTGVRWGREMNQERVTSASRSGGGHSTCLWCMDGADIYNINSWGKGWNGDGLQTWTKSALQQMISRGGTFIGYSPERFEYPKPEPITFEVE